MRFPPTALIGRHQALSREVDAQYCQTHGVGIARRITGGGAIYFDERQLGWELVFDRKTLGIGTLAELTREICEGAAAGLSRLGVTARYRPRNDIEVDGRKISGTGGFFDQDTLFYQGTVLVDLNPAEMTAALKVPQAKLAKRSLDSAAQRVVTLKELLGAAPSIEAIQQALLAGFAQRLGIAPEPGGITPQEEELAARYFQEEIGTDAFVGEIDDPPAADDVRSASHTGPGGTITVYAQLAGAQRERIDRVLITGDFFVTPPRTVFDLEAALRQVPVAEAGAAIDRFFERAEVGLLSVSPGDFRSAVEAAVGAAH